MRARCEDIRFYLDVLKNTECRCERTKGRGQAFCQSCYFSLPREIRRDLHQPVGGGFEEAYEAACDYLSD